MPLFKYFLSSLMVTSVLLNPISASQIKSELIPNFIESIKWHAVAYEDGNRRINAKLPGKPEEIIKNGDLCLFHSTHCDVHYLFYFRPAFLFHPPATLEEFIERFSYLENAQIMALSPKQPHLRYLLQIHMINTPGMEAILRVYATENTLYFAMVEGGDLSFAGDFFRSIQIDEGNPLNR